MGYGFMDIAGTPSVRVAQAKMGSDQLWTGRPLHRDFDRFRQEEIAYIAERGTLRRASRSRKSKRPCAPCGKDLEELEAENAALRKTQDL